MNDFAEMGWMCVQYDDSCVNLVVCDAWGLNARSVPCVLWYAISAQQATSHNCEAQFVHRHVDVRGLIVTYHANPVQHSRGGAVKEMAGDLAWLIGLS